MNVRVEAPSAGAKGSAVMDAPVVDLHRHIALFRRRQRLFLAVLVGVFVASILITLQLTPRYTATATVMIDTRQHKVVDVQQVLSGLGSDTGTIDSEVEVLKSRTLASKVVDQLDLMHDQEFNAALQPPGLLKTITGGGAADPQSDKQRQSVVSAVMARLKISRQGLTYVINVSYQSTSPIKAAKIANTFADRYLTEQLDAKFDATRRASQWLNERLGGLHSQVEQAENAVAQYKASNGLMALSAGDSGATITQQEISNLNTQLATARAQQAEADAKLSTARQQLSRGSTGDDVGEALSSPVIQQLRSKRTEVSGQMADLAGRYGPRHPEMLKAQRQLSDIDSQIQAEIQRLVSNLDAQAQVARQRTASLSSSVAGSKGTLATANVAGVRLGELQRNADSVRTLYQSFLDRFKQTSTDQGLEQSDARIISAASVPSVPSFPNVPLSAAIGLILAIATAVGILFVMEALERGLYTSEDVERTLDAPYAGATPKLSSVQDGGKKHKASPVQYVIDKPLSSFTEAFRALKTSLMASKVGQKVQVVAVTSSLPNEGKTTTTICLARVSALGGTATLVIDCDLRRRTVNRLFRTEPEVGLLEVLNGTATLEQAILYDDASGAYFLPLARSSFTPRDVFATEAMDRLLAEVRQRFDLILLDTAPVLPVADTRVIAPKADAVLFLCQWRNTPRKAAENALKQLDAVGAYVGGVALTQVDMKEQARSGYGDASYYYRAYKNYYAT